MAFLPIGQGKIPSAEGAARRRNLGEGFMMMAVAAGHNSLYLQGKLLARALGRAGGRNWRILGTGRLRSLPVVLRCLCSRQPIVYHYGGFDPLATLLMYRPRTVFVYHNITPFALLKDWQPLVALRALLGRLQLALAPRTLRWVAVSPFNAESLGRLGFQNVEYCPCMVPPRTSAAKTLLPSLLFVGRISPSKNCLELLERVEEAARLAQTRITLHVVGSGKKRCRYARMFRRRVERRQARGRLELIWHEQPLPRSRLDELYGSAWLYVSAARHEGFGLPVLEAVSSGTPAVYLECGGTETVLRGGGAIPGGAGATLAATIAQLLGDDALRSDLLRRQQDIARGLTPENLAPLIMDVYGRSLGAGGSVTVHGGSEESEPIFASAGKHRD